MILAGGTPIIGSSSLSSSISSAASSVSDFFSNLWTDTKTEIKYDLLKAGTYTKHAGLPVAGELLDLSLMEKDEREATVVTSGGTVLTPQQTKDLYKNWGITGTVNVAHENMNLPTYMLSKNDASAKALNNNKAFQDHVKSCYNSPDDAKISMFLTSKCNDADLYLAFGRVNVIGLHEVGNGYVEGYVEDVYDFDTNYGKASTSDSFMGRMKSAGVDKLNSMAVDLQNKGRLHNYRTLIPIRVKVK